MGMVRNLKIIAPDLMVPWCKDVRNIMMNLPSLALLLLAPLLAQEPVEKPLETVKDAPVVVPFAPGLEVRELPVALSNLNNLEYAPDGRLFAAGYDGRLHLLRDPSGRGLEDEVTTFYETKSDDYQKRDQVSRQSIRNE